MPSRQPRRPRTKWGDREGRRRDLLAAARAILEHDGYERLTIRDVARGARVSLGTVYTYFGSREALFAALYAERLEAFHAEIAPLCERAQSAEQLFVELGERYLDVYRVFGREVNLWAMLADANRLPPELARPMITVATRTMAVVAAALERLGMHVNGDARVVPFLWATLNGLADHFTGQRHRLHRLEWADVAGFAARTLVAGLAAPPTRPTKATQKSKERRR
jgi:AcrR family transcriptional regulator